MEKGGKPRPACVLLSRSSLAAAPASRLCSPPSPPSPPSPVIDSCQPSAVESFTRTKVDIAALAALPSSPRPLLDPYPTHRDPSLYLPAPTRRFFSFPSLCVYSSPGFFFFFFSSDVLFVQRTAALFLCSLLIHFVTPLSVRVRTYVRVARFASIRLPFLPQLSLVLQISHCLVRRLFVFLYTAFVRARKIDIFFVVIRFFFVRQVLRVSHSLFICNRSACHDKMELIFFFFLLVIINPLMCRMK